MEDEESIIHKIKTLTTQYLNIIIKQMKNILDEHGTLTHISSRIV